MLCNCPLWSSSPLSSSLSFMLFRRTLSYIPKSDAHTEQVIPNNVVCHLLKRVLCVWGIMYKSHLKGYTFFLTFIYNIYKTLFNALRHYSFFYLFKPQAIHILYFCHNLAFCFREISYSLRSFVSLLWMCALCNGMCCSLLTWKTRTMRLE